MAAPNIISNIIRKLEEHQFDQLVKLYLEEKYQSSVVIVNGSGDGGNDFLVTDTGKRTLIHGCTVIKRGFSNKCESDLKLMEELKDKHSYSDTVFYFYNQCPQEKTKNKLNSLASSKYGLTVMPPKI